MNSNAFYNSNWFSSLLGAVVGAAISLLTTYLNNKKQEKTEKKNLLVLIIHSNGKLFSLIHRGAINKNKIDYYEIRKELLNCDFVWILPNNLKNIFEELYEIYSCDGDEFDSKKFKTYECFVRINDELNRYGVDIFGDKQ